MKMHPRRHQSRGEIASRNGNIVAVCDIDENTLEKSKMRKGFEGAKHYFDFRTMFEEMNRALSQNRLKPVIDRVFPFTESPDAFRHLASGAHFGKVVISV